MPSVLLCSLSWHLGRDGINVPFRLNTSHHYFKTIRQGSMGMLANISNSSIRTHFLYESWLSSIVKSFDELIITQNSQVYQAFMLSSYCAVIKKKHLTFLAVTENFRYWISLHWVNWVIFSSLCGQKGKHWFFNGWVICSCSESEDW